MLIVLVSILSLVGGGLYCIYHWRQRRATYHIVACEDNIASNTLNNTLNDTANEDTSKDTTPEDTATKEHILPSDKKNSLEKWTLR
jgi:hypothetical protein